MYLIEILRVAVGTLLENKIRALLTMLGIIVGIGSVIAVVALGTGAQKAVEEKIASMASTDLDLRSARGRRVSTSNMFDLETIHALQARSDLIEYVMLMPFAGDVPVKYHNNTALVQVCANLPSYAPMYGLRLQAGRFFTEAEDAEKRLVAVVGSEAAKNLGGGASMVGRTVRLYGKDLLVVGVLEPRGTVGWFEPDRQVIIPLGTSERITGRVWLMALQLKLVDNSDLRSAATEVERIVRHARRNMYDEPSAFAVSPPFVDVEKLKQETAETFSSLLLSVAAISLIVGGIGVMNIMLASVAERTREIGIRKALGARRSIVLLQFVLEAVALCLLGGLLGVAGGVGSVYFFADKFGWLTVITPESVFVALGFSVSVGLFFGIWPAMRAARMDPVEALRYE